MSSAESTVPASCDVLVVGAGPAGCAAAITLARAGRRVVIIDKAVFPRDKCCGDGLTTLALRELEPLGLRPQHVPNWQTVTDVWLRSPSGREVQLPMPTDGIFAATTPRRELDAALVKLAREAGATVHEGQALTAVRAFHDHVQVDVAGPEVAGPEVTGPEDKGGTTITAQHVTAQHLVAADGVWSPTRKLLGLAEPGYLGEWHAFRQYARNVTGPAAQRLYVWFEPDMLPGYAWSFPLPDGRVNLGFGVTRDGNHHRNHPRTHTGKSMAAQWAGLIDRPHIRAALGPDVELEERHTALPIPAGIDKAVLSHGRVLFVGDAARATDVMTGEGIGQAVLTGRLAGEAILSGRDAALTYERTVRDELFADHRMSKVLNGWLAKPLLARGAVRVVGLNGWTKRHFVRWMFEDEHRAIVFTPRRWHRGFLKRRGTYR